MAETEEEKHDSDMSDLVARLYAVYVKFSPEHTFIMSHDLAFWAYGEWLCSISEYYAIRQMPNIPLSTGE